jgi:hypothetical protein
MYKMQFVIFLLAYCILYIPAKNIKALERYRFKASSGLGDWI